MVYLYELQLEKKANCLPRDFHIIYLNSCFTLLTSEHEHLLITKLNIGKSLNAVNFLIMWGDDDIYSIASVCTYYLFLVNWILVLSRVKVQMPATASCRVEVWAVALNIFPLETRNEINTKQPHIKFIC